MANDSKKRKWEEQLDRGRDVLQTVLEKLILISPTYRPHTLKDILSSRLAHGDLKSKHNILQQNLLSLNPMERKKVEKGDLTQFDISLLTALLRITQISGLKVAREKWTEFSNTTELEENTWFCPLKPGGKEIDTARDVKLAGLISVVSHYRNQGSHSTKETNLTTLTDEFYMMGCSDMVKALKGMQKILKEVDLEIVKHRTNCVQIDQEHCLGCLPDYMPIKSLSLVGHIANTEAKNRFSKGDRFFSKITNNLDDILSNINGYFKHYPNETIILMVNEKRTFQNSNIVYFNKCGNTLGDVRGKIVLVCGSDNAEICCAKNIKTIEEKFKSLGASVADDDDLISITISKSQEVSGKIQDVLKEAFTSVGCIRIDHPMTDPETFSTEVMKVNVRQVHMRKMMIENDDRLPDISKFKDKRILDKLREGLSVCYIAINQSSTAAEIVLEHDYSMASFTSLLNDLSDEMVINISEKSQISDKLGKVKVSAIQHLLAILQDKKDEKEKDVSAFIMVLVKNKFTSLALFLEEMIEKVKRVKKTMGSWKERVENNDENVKMCSQQQMTIKLDREQQGEIESGADSAAEYDSSMELFYEEDPIIPNWMENGSNHKIKTGSIEITMDVEDEWEVENLTKSIKHGLFLKSYCNWLVEKGINVKENEQINIKVMLGDKIFFVHSQKTPEKIDKSDDEKVFEEAFDLYRAKIKSQISLKEYFTAEEMSWAHFFCNSVGNVERYENSWQERIKKITMDGRKEDVHHLIHKEVHPDGGSPALESLFQRYSSNLLADEFLSLYKIYCENEIHFGSVVQEYRHRITNATSVEDYLNHESSAWIKFRCKAKGLTELYQDKLEERIKEITMGGRKEEVHRLIHKEIQPHGKSPALESVFQRYSNTVLANEFNFLYKIYCENEAYFWYAAKEYTSRTRYNSSLEDYLSDENFAWKCFISKAKGSPELYQDKWQERIKHITMFERKEEVHRLIQQHGRSPALESLFQRYSKNFLADEFQSVCSEMEATGRSTEGTPQASGSSSEKGTNPVKMTTIRNKESCTSTHIDWDAAHGATSYDITITSSNHGKPIKPTQNTENNEITFLELMPDTPYEVTVTPKNEVSVGQTKTMTIKTLPLKMLNITESFVTCTSAKLDWEAVEGALTYEIRRKGCDEVETTDKNTHKLVNLNPGTAYCIDIIPIADGIQGKPNYITINTRIQMSELKSSDITCESAKLEWKAAVGATSYDIVVNGKAIINTAETEYQLTGLIHGTDHAVEVSPKNDRGTGESKSITVSTLRSNVDYALAADNKLTKKQCDYLWNEIGPSVCRIIVPGSTGTGFVVGSLQDPNTQQEHVVILTCHHVKIQDAIHPCFAEFGYTDQGQPATLKVKIASAHFASDEKLDYILVALDYEQQLLGFLKTKMGSLIPKYQKPLDKAPLIIIGHPDGNELQLDPAAYCVPRPNNTHKPDEYIFYHCRSFQGASGAPVMSKDKRILYAMHCGGSTGPASQVGPSSEVEHGVALWEVLQDIKVKAQHDVFSNRGSTLHNVAKTLFPQLY